MNGHEHAPDAHGVRPTDLVALVTFDDEVYENHAFSRERLARPGEAPRPLGAAIEQWLGLGRRTWIDVRGRQIEGIATARELGRSAWLIDTLIDASGGDGGGAVLSALLRQAHDTALEERVTHVLLRTRLDSPALPAALHHGFKQVLAETTWYGELQAGEPSEGGSAVSIRRAVGADDAGRFQVFNRSLPLDAREAIALTLLEWQHTRERRWLQRGGTEWVAIVNGAVAGALSLSSSRSFPQLEIVVDGSTPDVAPALADHAVGLLAGRGNKQVLAVAAAGGAAERTLSARGLQPQSEYGLLCLRLARPIPATQRARASLAVPTRG